MNNIINKWEEIKKKGILNYIFKKLFFVGLPAGIFWFITIFFIEKQLDIFIILMTIFVFLFTGLSSGLLS